MTTSCPCPGCSTHTHFAAHASPPVTAGACVAGPSMAIGAVPLSRGGVPLAGNGRPYNTHDRACDAELHLEHYESICQECGCCWGCDDDCCAEWFCPNDDCGCSRAARVSGEGASTRLLTEDGAS